MREGERSPLAFLGRMAEGAPAYYKAGVMLSPDILQRKSLFFLLHRIDIDLAEGVRSSPCPTVGGLCIMADTRVSLGEAPQILTRLFRFA